MAEKIKHDEYEVIESFEIAKTVDAVKEDASEEELELDAQEAGVQEEINPEESKTESEKPEETLPEEEASKDPDWVFYKDAEQHKSEQPEGEDTDANEDVGENECSSEDAVEDEDSASLDEDELPFDDVSRDREKLNTSDGIFEEIRLRYLTAAAAYIIPALAVGFWLFSVATEGYVPGLYFTVHGSHRAVGAIPFLMCLAIGAFVRMWTVKGDDTLGVSIGESVLFVAAAVGLCAVPYSLHECPLWVLVIAAGLVVLLLTEGCTEALWDTEDEGYACQLRAVGKRFCSNMALAVGAIAVGSALCLFINLIFG